jgi:hypothetical protein
MVSRVVCCLLLIAAPSAATAQTPYESGAWLVTPGLGLALDPDADASPTISIAAAHVVAPSVLIEAELGHLFDFAPGDADVDSSLTTFHGGVLYVFDTAYVAMPYVAAGIGIGRFSHDVRTPPASIDRTEIGASVGAGVAYPIRDQVLIRGDFRYFTHVDDVPSAWRFSAMLTFAVTR